MTTKKQGGEPAVCAQHAARHADARCQVQCFACGDCFKALVEALEGLLRESKDVVNFLGEMEANCNPACDPENGMAPWYWMLLMELQRRNEAARSALSLAKGGGE